MAKSFLGNNSPHLTTDNPSGTSKMLICQSVEIYFSVDPATCLTPCFCYQLRSFSRGVATCTHDARAYLQFCLAGYRCFLF